jgi:outer membrane protein insertion porin family
LRRNVYSLKYTDPWFMGIRMPTTFGFELRPKVRSEHEQEYDIASWSIKVSTLRKFGRYLRADFGVEYESVDITGIPAEDIPIIKQENGVSERRKVYFSLRRDSRDHLFIPKIGSITEGSVEYVGGFLGGDDNFFGIQGSWSRFQVLWPGWVAATRVKGGWVRPFGNSSTVPSNDRLYLGGANTVRGFRENSLGPLADDGTAVGARYILLFNQEFRWKTLQVLQKLPFVGSFFNTLPLWQSVFVDIGNGFNSLEEIKLSSFAYSYGTGLQMVSPAGPIRLDYARRIATDRYSFDSRWHFTILYAF